MAPAIMIFLASTRSYQDTYADYGTGRISRSLGLSGQNGDEGSAYDTDEQ